MKIRLTLMLMLFIAFHSLAFAGQNTERNLATNSLESSHLEDARIIPSPYDVDNGRVLLVDDYVDRDEYDNPLDYQFRRRFYERWGVHHFDYDLWVVADEGGFPDSTTVLNYQAILIASEANEGQTDGTWLNDIGEFNGEAIRYYLENEGHLLVVGALALLDMSSNYPTALPGDFEYDWLGIDSTEWSFDYWDDFTWAIGAEPGYPSAMKLDITKDPDQVDYAMEMPGLREGVDTLFTWGLDINGNEPNAYGHPVGIIYRPDGEAVTSLLSFSMYGMENEQAETTMTNILRDEFGCTYYDDPVPLPPWQLVAYAPSDSLILLSWDSIDEEDVVEINIYRAIFDGPFTLLTTLDETAFNYLDSDVTSGTEYNYYLTCTDSAEQESERTRIVTEYAGRPQAPDNISIINGDNEVELLWRIPDNPIIDHFNIYKQDGYGEPFDFLTTVPSSDSSYSDASVTNLSAYRYYLTSTSDDGVDSYSSDTLLGFPYSSVGRAGLLIVNGVDWETYTARLTSFYQDEVPSGNQSDYRVWDLFRNANMNAFPDESKYLGVGSVPPYFFEAFEKIVWVGNNYNGDLDCWLERSNEIMDYLNSNGNLLLLTRRGETFFFHELYDWCGITSYTENINPSALVALHDSLTDIVCTLSQSLSTAIISGNSSTIQLYQTEDIIPGAGFYTQGPGRSGNFAYIAGRPYRWDNDDLKENVDVILRYFFEIQTDIEDDNPTTPVSYELSQNYPNPFNPVTAVKFGVPTKSHVTLEIFDILGRKVNTLLDNEVDAGYHTVIWNGKTSDGNPVSSGVYFYRISAGDYTDSRKMTILK